MLSDLSRPAGQTNQQGRPCARPNGLFLCAGRSAMPVGDVVELVAVRPAGRRLGREARSGRRLVLGELVGDGGGADRLGQRGGGVQTRENPGCHIALTYMPNDASGGRSAAWCAAHRRRNSSEHRCCRNYAVGPLQRLPPAGPTPALWLSVELGRLRPR